MCVPEYDLSDNSMFLLFLLLPLAFIILSLVYIHKYYKKIQKIKNLCKKGTLYKNLPYTLETSDISVNGKRLQIIRIDFILPNGLNVSLVSEPRYDNKHTDMDGKADLLLDPNDYNNYYIDFNIETK